MPKKTRKEKIIAELRRKLENSNQYVPQKHESNTVHEIKPNEKIITGTYKLNLQSTQKQETPKKNIINTSGYGYVTSDIRRISFFTVLAISFQLALFWILRNGTSLNIALPK